MWTLFRGYINCITDNITVSSNLNIVSKDINGNELKNDSAVGTGTIINIMENDKSLASYTVIIRGDVNGDGKITSSDYVNIKNKQRVVGKT